MTQKSKDDQKVWAEFIQQLDQSKSRASQRSETELAPESDAWERITHQISQLNHHRHTYSIKTPPLRVQQKRPNVSSYDKHSFHGLYNLDEEVPNLDRDDKKHLNKVMSHQISVIDLHGYTLAQAYEQLKFAISHALQKKSKILKVITGKGRPNPEPESPTLKAIFPKWMQEPYFKSKVYKVRIASIPHGGEGAFLAYLKYSNPTK